MTGSLEELALVDDLERLVIDLETGVRGFVITRDERFLGTVGSGPSGVSRSCRRSSCALTDDPVEDPLARQISADVESYIDDYAVPLVEAARRGDPTASSVAATGRESSASTRFVPSSTATAA